MFGGGGGLNPRKMKQMMEQMGIDLDELDAEEVVIRLADGSELVFDDADVTKMEARGQETYQVVGEPERRDSGGVAGEVEAAGAETDDSGSAAGEVEADDAGDEGAPEGDIPDADVDLVAQQAGVTEEAAREALEAEGGDLAAAISRLE